MGLSGRAGPLALRRHIVTVVACAVGAVVTVACTPSSPSDEAAPTPTTTALTEPVTGSASATRPLPATGSSTIAPGTGPGGGGDDDGAPSRCGEPPTDQQTVAMWHTLTAESEGALQTLADAYEALHPGTSIELTHIDGGPAGVVARLSETPPASLPDVVMGADVSVRLQADSGRFVPVTDCAGGTVPPSLADVLTVVAETYTVGGTRWAAPFNVSTPVLVYDKARWRAAGLDPDQPPTTLDELERAIRQLKDSGAAAAGIALYDKSASWLVSVTAAQAGELLAVPANGRGSDPVDTIQLDRAAVIDTLDRFRVLKQEGYVAWLGYDTGAGGADDLVALINPLEPAGMTFHTSGSLGVLAALKDRGGSFAQIDVGVAEMPGPGRGALAGGGAWWLVDTGDPQRVGAAWQVVEWMTAPEQIATFAAATGYAPTSPTAAALPQVVEQWAQAPFLKVPYDQLVASSGTPAGAGLQVGPGIEVDRELELAAAFTIDAGNAAVDELRLHGAAILDLITAYEAARAAAGASTG